MYSNIGQNKSGYETSQIHAAQKVLVLHFYYFFQLNPQQEVGRDTQIAS